MTLNVNIPSILHTLGAGKDRVFVLSSLCLVLIVFFYFFVLGSSLQTKIYTFQNRVTYESIFDTHIVDLNADLLILLLVTIAWIYLSLKDGYKKYGIIILFSIFLAFLFLNLIPAALVGAVFTLPFVSALMILERLRNKKILKHDVRLSLVYVTIASIVLAALGIISLLLFVINGVPIVTITNYPYAIFQQILSLLTPFLMAALIFCIPLKVTLNQFVSKMKAKRHLFGLDIAEVELSTKRIGVYLSLCVVLGVGVALIPHLPVINPHNERLGVDSPRYVDWLNQMENQTANPIYFALQSRGDRPLTLIILSLITQVAKADPFQVAEYSPLFLTPLLIMATFFLTRQLTSNDRISIMAAYLSAISFQTLIGIYSGFYANWLALILGYLGFALIAKYLKRPSKLSLVALAVVMTGVLLTHLYTWSIIISIAFVFLFVLHIVRYYPRKRFLILYLILSSSIAVDILKSSLTGSSTGLEEDVSVGINYGFGISQFSERLRTIAEAVQTYYGGVYANIAILGLVMYWLVRCKPKEMANIFVLIFLSSALVPLFLGDWVLQSRVLYNIPFQIPAAISLYAIWKEHHKIIFIAILLIACYLSLHVLANLGYVPPSSPFSLVD